MGGKELADGETNTSIGTFNKGDFGSTVLHIFELLSRLAIHGD